MPKMPGFITHIKASGGFDKVINKFVAYHKRHIPSMREKKGKREKKKKKKQKRMDSNLY